MKKFFYDFRIVDSENDFLGALFIQDGRIEAVLSAEDGAYSERCAALMKAALWGGGSVFYGGGRLVLMPSFIDMHAHFREPGTGAKETLESASLAAVRGGWTTIVCMANTTPVIDNIDLAQAVRERALNLKLIDLYPVLSLTKAMGGVELSGFASIDSRSAESRAAYRPLLLSEDGKDVEDDDVFFKALCKAAELNIPVSCHCDLGGEEKAVRRAIELGRKAGAALHIAHVSTKASCAIIAEAKKIIADLHAEGGGGGTFTLSAEATVHHLTLNEERAALLGKESFGKVAPPLRSEEDRLSLIEALRGGVIDVIATDHAPHSEKDKAGGAPGFSGLETAFPVLRTVLVSENGFSLCDISRFLSAAPAKILGLQDRGRVQQGLRADLAVIDCDSEAFFCKADFKASRFFSRGKNTPFVWPANAGLTNTEPANSELANAGLAKKYFGYVRMTLCNGAIVYED